MNVASTAFHLLGALRRAIGRVLLFFLIFLIVGGAIMEVLLWIVAGSPSLSNYHPAAVTHVAAALLGVAFGYAAAMTVLVKEAIRFLIDAIQSVERDVKGELTGGSKILETVIHSIEQRGR
jgi:hypothetical protein